MIDWLTFSAPWAHEAGALSNGQVLAVDASGQVEWISQRWLPVFGSYEARVMVRSDPRASGYVEVSGNPSKFLQGHNLFGSDDVHGLAVLMLEKLDAQLGRPPSANDRAAWSSGDMPLRMIDLTQSYSVGTRERARNALRAVHQYGVMSYRGQGSLVKGGTLYYAQKSRRWALKFYVKGDELEAGKGHGLPPPIARYEELASWADDKLRVEMRIHSMQLKEWMLATIGAWKTTTAALMRQFAMEKLKISDAAILAPDVIEELPPRLQAAYQLWRDGHDLRELFPRRTFYRYRAELTTYGVDVAVRPNRDGVESNVIPLRVVLHAEPAPVPEWASGTELYVEPRRKVG